MNSPRGKGLELVGDVGLEITTRRLRVPFYLGYFRYLASKNLRSLSSEINHLHVRFKMEKWSTGSSASSTGSSMPSRCNTLRPANYLAFVRLVSIRLWL